jgi:hypothetical protein
MVEGLISIHQQDCHLECPSINPPAAVHSSKTTSQRFRLHCSIPKQARTLLRMENYAGTPSFPSATYDPSTNLPKLRSGFLGNPPTTVVEPFQLTSAPHPKRSSTSGKQTRMDEWSGQDITIRMHHARQGLLAWDDHSHPCTLGFTT